MTIDDVLLSLVNECDNCAIMGERIMCQSAPKEEIRLRCVALAKIALLKIIQGVRPENREQGITLVGLTPKELENNRGFNQGVEATMKTIEDMFK